MICRAKPYEGEQPYIFLSYCHKDNATVYRIIETMAQQGYRIWYDSGIHPGDDWVETIAAHISNCNICIAVVTSRSVMSHNCRNEINFVIEHGKALVPIILEDFTMTLGVRMQLSSCQYIKKFEFQRDADFYAALYSANGLAACRGSKSLLDHVMLEQVQRRDMELKEIEKREAETDKLKKAKESLMAGIGPSRTAILSKAADNSLLAHSTEGLASSVVHTKNTPELSLSTEDASKDNPTRNEYSDIGTSIDCRKTDVPAHKPAILQDTEDSESLQDDPSEDFIWKEGQTAFEDERTVVELQERTIRIKNPMGHQAYTNAGFVYLAGNSYFEIKKDLTKIGRDKLNCDITFSNKTISSLHAEILRTSQGFFIRDMDSSNGTTVDGQVIDGMEPVQLKKLSTIILAKEICLFFSETVADFYANTKRIAVLECVETGEVVPLSSKPFEIGRANRWPGGTFSDKRASRHHGTIRFEECSGKYILRVESASTNGTFLNGKIVMPTSDIELEEDDELGIGSAYHIRIHFVKLNIGGVKK